VFHEDRTPLRAVPGIAGSLLMRQGALQTKPVATVATLRKAAGLTTPTVNSLLRELESPGIVKESTGRARDRVCVYRRDLEALAAEEGGRRECRRGVRRVKELECDDAIFCADNLRDMRS
jgi:hypothetical protein